MAWRIGKRSSSPSHSGAGGRLTAGSAPTESSAGSTVSVLSSDANMPMPEITPSCATPVKSVSTKMKKPIEVVPAPAMGSNS